MAASKESRMKRHAPFFATALAVASLGAAGLAAAQSAPAAAKSDARTDVAHAAARGERPGTHGRRHGSHGMRGGIERMDADGDGRVSRAEFDAAIAARKEARAERIARAKAEAGQRGERPERAGRAERAGPGGGGPGARKVFDFDAIDANRDGYIVRREVSAHRERMRQEMGARRAQRMADAFVAADLDKDGKLSRVEVDEKMPRLSARFAWLDDNRDGFLGRDELEAGQRR
jgi:Ca2+-binding EF-hand superfamily protein